MVISCGFMHHSHNDSISFYLFIYMTWFQDLDADRWCLIDSAYSNLISSQIQYQVKCFHYQVCMIYGCDGWINSFR